MALLGVDVGSSRCKAVVFRDDGRVLAEAARDYRPSFPAPAHVEMDPETLVAAVFAAIAEAAACAPEPVQALGLSSHGESFLPVDTEGRPLAPIIMNADNRATAEAREIEEAFGREPIFRLTGHLAHPMYPLAKLRWLRAHQPDLFRSAARFVGIIEYLLLRLGLPPLLGESLAGRFLAFDVRRREWSGELLALADLMPEQLPTPVPGGTLAGKLSRTAAADLGLPEGISVVVGGHDQPCGALGMGALAPGLVTDSMGSYECLVAVTDQPSLGPEALAGSLNSYPHVLPDQYITIAYFPAGLMVQWFVDTFCEGDAAAAREAGATVYDLLESRGSPGPTGLCITPHLIGSGNPHFDTRARAALVGVAQTTTRYDFYKGILEGLACELSLIADLLAAAAGDFRTLRGTGGGARSRLGLQLRATISGRTFETMESAEAVCLGAALLAGVSAGTYASLAEAVRAAVRVGGSVAPDPAQAQAYTSQVARYRALYPALAPLREIR